MPCTSHTELPGSAQNMGPPCSNLMCIFRTPLLFYLCIGQLHLTTSLKNLMMIMMCRVTACDILGNNNMLCLQVHWTPMPCDSLCIDTTAYSSSSLLLGLCTCWMMFTSPLAISRRRHSVFGLSSVRDWVCAWACTKSLWTRHLTISPKLTTLMQLGTGMNGLDFEIKRPKLRSKWDHIIVR